MRMRPATPELRLPRAALVAAVALAALASPTAAQSAAPATSAASTRSAPGDTAIVYRREVFRYYPSGRPDPFRPLVGDADLGVRLEHLALRGVVSHTDPSRSVAVLAREGQQRLVRVRIGQSIGGIRVLAIRPNSIDVLVEELGVARRATLQITRAPAPKGEES